MVYKRFYVIIVFRIILLTFNALILSYYWWLPGLFHVKFALVVLLIVQVILLIWFLNRINRKLSSFFDSIRSDDYSMGFTNPNKRGEYTGLNLQLDKLSKYFLKLKVDNEQKNLYFKAVIDHVATGILSFDQLGKINFINRAALRMVGLEHLKNIASLDNHQAGLSDLFIKMQPGTQHLIEIQLEKEDLQLSARSVVYKAGEEVLTLISLQNIRPELEHRETQTWQKLIRILTHEIMNSISPITSLAASLSRLVNKSDIEVPNDKTMAKLNKGLSTIKNRGDGLVEFVTKYRELTILPQPQIEEIIISELLEGIRMLIGNEFAHQNIEISIGCKPENLTLNGDRKMIDQVLLNLAHNACWAVGDVENRRIRLDASLEQNGIKTIRVIDNGKGISKENLDKIFIPFFTTREEGSGIGLSLSRQIMMMHMGSISARSIPGKETVFELVFPS